ncbi:hypothetical protein [Saccharothrix sp. Mg75]|uniref:hypothetical protein n=1 Tax=Saccharothrix sp. Mg75 TaxID=3445357 RepID=UPI003EE96109
MDLFDSFDSFRRFVRRRFTYVSGKAFRVAGKMAAEWSQKFVRGLRSRFGR